MSEWIDVPVADVRAGDECKVDGYGRGQGNTLVDVGGNLWYLAYSMTPETIWLQDVAGIAMVDFRRSSIVAVRRRKPEPELCRQPVAMCALPKGHPHECAGRLTPPKPESKPEPQPKPGDWRCRVPGTCPECLAACGCISREVYRASGGWSRDTRTGQPWVMQIGDPVEVVIKAVAGNLAFAFAGLPKAIAMAGYESLEDTYKRERLDVRPVDRRGKR